MGERTIWKTEKELAGIYGLTASGIYKQVSEMRGYPRYRDAILGEGKGTLVDEGAYLDFRRNRKSLRDAAWRRQAGRYKAKGGQLYEEP